MQQRSLRLLGQLAKFAFVPSTLIMWGCSGPVDSNDPEIGVSKQEVIDYTACPTGSTIIQGTAGNDVIDASSHTEPVCILGNDGDDTITGGSNNDFIAGGRGNDTINGGPGADRIHGEFGNDIIHGGDGNDYIIGEQGADQIFGDAGDDYLDGYYDSDIVFGGAGNDTIFGRDGDDVLHGDDGNDSILGGIGNDTLEGGNGDDRLQADDGDDHVWGDFINNATATSGSTVDTLYGNAGNDDLHGGPGNDLLYGNDGTDSLNGDDGDDRLVGGANGTKTISGGNGNDLAKGHDGTDVLSGDENNDVLVVAGSANGGNGTDACTGTSCELAEPPSFCSTSAGQCATGQRCAIEVGVCIYCQSDSECSGGAECIPTKGCTSSEVICNDGIDNDGDGNIDCADSDCALDLNCETGVTQLGNGGVFHECITNSSGQIKCWGRNTAGELGYFPAGGHSTAATVINYSLTSPKMVRGGVSHTCALLADGTVQCWGGNTKGQLGNGTTSTAGGTSAVAVSGLSGVTQLASGGNFNCAVLNTGGIKCWGENSFGQLGIGGTVSASSFSSTPADVTGLGGTAVEVKTGTQHACARLTSGFVQCWGRNQRGQLGNGITVTTAPPSTVPVSVVSLGSVAEVAVGGEFTCARRTNGNVLCWGANYAGQLGLGHAEDSVNGTPALLPGVTAATQLSAGWYHSCVARGTGQVMCWGMNDFGQTGAGSTSASKPTPFNLASINDGTNLGMGQKYTCLRRRTGNLSCWGDNTFGQIGNGTTTTPVLTPFTVTGVP